jgi:tetratricopeptide (TPR) repeat protein
LSISPVDTTSLVDQQIESLWQQAQEQMEAGRLSEAGRLCSQVLSIAGEHDEAKGMLEDIQCRDQQARQFYAKIERGVGYQSLDELLHLLQEAVSIYPDHPDGRLVQTQLLSVTRQYDEAIQKSAAAVDGGEWQVAQANLERARQINPGSPAVARLCEFVNEVRLQIQTMRNSIDAAVEQGQRSKAIFLARNLDTYLRQMSRPESRPQEWRTMHGYGNTLLNAYRFARQICSDVLGRTRRADRD